MARSIHTTRRDLQRLEASDFAAPQRRDDVLVRTRERLELKRRIKAAVRHERCRTAGGVTVPDSLPVVVADSGPHVHHVASVRDVREVLRHLPPGVLDGLARVELLLGAEYQEEYEQQDPSGAECDPLVGRLGYESFPGVYAGRVLGTYAPGTAVVRVNAYVFADEAPLRDVWEILLRLQALSTLVHEVAHHYDHTMRVARGRWLADAEERAEIYAEQRQHGWLHSVVVPFLRAAYPTDVARLEGWIEHHGGVALPLETLADDPRVTHKGGYTNVSATLWSMQQFVQELIENVTTGRSLSDCRVGFARDLHYRDMYDEALRSLDVVLREEPEHAAALTLRADILVHVERHAEALAIAEHVVARAPEFADAWRVVADACEALERWREVHAAADRLVGMSGDAPWRRAKAFVQRARSALRLGDLDRARADLERAEHEYPRSPNWRSVKGLRAELGVPATTAGATSRSMKT